MAAQNSPILAIETKVNDDIYVLANTYSSSIE